MSYLDEKERKDRRERIATSVFQGLLAGRRSNIKLERVSSVSEEAAETAVVFADALIAQLDKEEDSTEGK